jgi:hypothetical protein
MPATSRFVLFDVDETTGTSVTSSDTADPGSSNGRGTIGFAESNTTAPDTLTIQEGVNDEINFTVDGVGPNLITLTSGTDLDARFIARELNFKMKQIIGVDFTSVEYINNKYRIYSGTMGPSSSMSTAAGTNDVAADLELDFPNTTNGVANDNSGTYTGTMSVSGVYTGQFDDIYTLIIAETHPVGNAVAGGGNTYAGSATTAGDWNVSGSGTETYTITVDGSTNPTMNGGTGNVPVMTWTSSGSGIAGNDNDATGVELLYSDYFYEVGTKGLRVKFSDAPFGSSDTFTVTCTTASGGVDPVGTAEYHWSSLQEGKSSSATTTTVTPGGSRIGTRGVEVSFSSGSNLTAGDEFRIICSGPQPTTLGVTTLNYGAVTVSTYSPVKAVWFELMSGATILSNTKFGLQSHGTAQHHLTGSNDSLFSFGTAGKGTPAGTNPEIQTEWRTSVEASDISSDTPPDYLSATEDNLSEVSTADASESVGVGSGQMVSDFIWLAVKLGANESGANPSIVYRMFYDFS